METSQEKRKKKAHQTRKQIIQSPYESTIKYSCYATIYFKIKLISVTQSYFLVFILITSVFSLSFFTVRWVLHHSLVWIHTQGRHSDSSFSVLLFSMTHHGYFISCILLPLANKGTLAKFHHYFLLLKLLLLVNCCNS